MERGGARVGYFNLRTLLALCVVAVACLAQPRVLETHLILDGHIDHPMKVYAAQATLATAGVAAAIWSARRKPRRRSCRARLLEGLALALSCLFAAGVAELALRFEPELALDAETFGELQFRQRQGVTPAAYTSLFNAGSHRSVDPAFPDQSRTLVGAARRAFGAFSSGWERVARRREIEAMREPTPPGGLYRPRNPRASPLWQCASRHAGELRAAGALRRAVEEQALERFLACGDPHYGFARIYCNACGHDYLLA